MIRDFGLSLAKKQLSPGDSLSEILFGLVMTLTFTLGAGLLVRQDPDAARELLIATVGCNVAWGIIDGAFFISGQLFERARMALVGPRIREAKSEDAAISLVAEELDELMGLTVDAGERAELYQRMVRHIRSSRPGRPSVTRADFYGALASFWLVFFSSIPAALPFLIVPDAWRALRISNAILIASLFVVGYRWAGHTTLRPWRVGLTFTVAGVGLVALAIALGG